MDVVIFDMDGVLVNSEEFYFERRKRFFELHSLTFALSDLSDCAGKTNSEIWERLVPEDQLLRNKLKLEYKEYSKQNPIHYCLYKNKFAFETIKELKSKGKKLSIASSSPMEEIIRMMKECKFADYFDFVISGEELKKSKPNPEIYLKVIEYFGAHKEYLVVEDSKVGITAAKAANLFTLALKQKYDIDQSEADAVISDLSEVIRYL